MKILVVDDNEQNLYQLQILLSGNGYEVISAVNGAEALQKAREGNPPGVIISDILMPVMDGFTLCRECKKDASLSSIPFVFYTATYTNEKDREFALNLGAEEFIVKPEDPDVFIRIIHEVIRKACFSAVKAPVSPFDILVKEEKYLKTYNAVLVNKLEEKMIQLEQKNRELEKARDTIKKEYIATIQHLTATAEYRDKTTGSHLKRIGLYAKLLAEIMGLSADMSEILYIIAPMHDLGKIGIPDKILLKPGPLTPEEFEIVKKHTIIGAEILKGSDYKYLKIAEKIALSHHEKWDGTGYPYGLKGEEISIESRIMSIIDQYDAIRSRRPYKPPLDHNVAYRIITEGDGKSNPSQFDPDVLKAFKKYHQQFNKIYESFK